MFVTDPVVAHSTGPASSMVYGPDGIEESGEMFRRVGRPGLIGTVARTAVVAGTATATANAVNNRQAKKAAEKQANADQQAADQQAAYQQQNPPPQQYAPQPVYQAPPPPPAPAAEPAPAGGDDDIVGQIGQLAKLKEAGVLSDAEFAAAKAKLLGL